MPRRFQQSDGAHTTRQKGRARGKGLSTYARKGKGKHAERYTRPYLTGEYREWPHRRFDDEYETSTGLARTPRQANGHNRAKRPSKGINSSH